MCFSSMDVCLILFAGAVSFSCVVSAADHGGSVMQV